MKTICTIVGARPQFIKASVVSRAIREAGGVREVLLHTGQHFDSNMSAVFFSQLGIPSPDVCLNINGSSHGSMTGRMLIEIERELLKYQPERVLVYGDTNSTLSGAVAAVKLKIPVAHVEAGLRSFNRFMPEEINRVIVDQISDILFCPTARAVDNLEAEGLSDKCAQILNVGDVMQDAALMFAKKAVVPSNITLPDDYILATFHRAENTDDTDRLAKIVEAMNVIHREHAPIIAPLHPRTKKAIESIGLTLKIHVIDPVGYLEMLALVRGCKLVITDSGGLQKEAFFFGKACVTTRDETEWVELLELDANVLVGADKDAIIYEASSRFGTVVRDQGKLFGGGEASQRIAAQLQIC